MLQEQLLEEVEAAKERQLALAVGSRGLLDSLATERWQFTRQAECARKRLYETPPVADDVKALPVTAHPIPIFSTMTSKEIEIVLMIWEFINTASGLLGDIKLSLEEITRAAIHQTIRDPSGLELPSLEQLYYDELCVTLVKLLLMELR